MVKVVNGESLAGDSDWEDSNDDFFNDDQVGLQESFHRLHASEDPLERFELETHVEDQVDKISHTPHCLHNRMHPSIVASQTCRKATHLKRLTVKLIHILKPAHAQLLSLPPYCNPVPAILCQCLRQVVLQLIHFSLSQDQPQSSTTHLMEAVIPMSSSARSGMMTPFSVLLINLTSMHSRSKLQNG